MFPKVSGKHTNLWIRDGAIQYFRRKNFFSVPKNFVGELLNVSETFGYRKISCMRRGYHYSPFKIFRLTTQIAEKIRRETLQCFRKIRESKTFMHKKGKTQFSVETFLVSQCRKNSWGNPAMFQKISRIENFYA